MRSMNHVQLLGRVGLPPELRKIPNGNSVANFRMATDRFRPNQESVPDWHNIVCWGKTAEAVCQYAGKGDRIAVTGRLTESSWKTEDGQNRYRTEVTAVEVIFLEPKAASVVVEPDDAEFDDEDSGSEGDEEDTQENL